MTRKLGWFAYFLGAFGLAGPACGDSGFVLNTDGRAGSAGDGGQAAEQGNAGEAGTAGSAGDGGNGGSSGTDDGRSGDAGSSASSSLGGSGGAQGDGGSAALGGAGGVSGDGNSAGASAGGTLSTAGAGGIGGETGEAAAGGEAGEAGAGGSPSAAGGLSGSSGSSGEGGAPPTGPGDLGSPCENDSDCDGLTCVTSDSSDFDAFPGVIGGPPKGFCTVACFDDPDSCQELDPGALCADVSAGVAYCFEGCSFGPPELTAFQPDKCHGRSEFACTAVFPATGSGCESAFDCGPGEICFGGSCFLEVPICLPQCNGDQDCPAGRACQSSPSLAAPGICVEDEADAIEHGEACDPAATDPGEQCEGLCLATAVDDAGDAVVSVCSETCTIGALPVCGYSGVSGQPARCRALFDTDGVGDLGVCLDLCDCNDDCRGIERCIRLKANGEPAPSEPEGAPGLCFYPFDADGELLIDPNGVDGEPVELIDCPALGAP